MNKSVTVDGVNRELGLITLRTGEVLPIAGWHDAERDEVDPSEATFVTFFVPGKGWSYAILSDFYGLQN